MKITSACAALAVGVALVAAPVSGLLGTAAAATGCTATDDQIYTPPATVTGSPGDIIACKSTGVPFVLGAPATKAWKVQYVTQDAKGNLVAAAGLIIVPTAAWTGSGPRPTVSYDPFTHGSAQSCAISRQLTTFPQDDFESPLIGSDLSKGWAVAESDGIGYLTGEEHTYVNGLANGHAALDLLRASHNLADTGLAANGPIGIDGYSEGGSTSIWEAQLASSYAPELNIVGAASGGIPADLEAAANQLNGLPFAGFLADALVGFNYQYPEMPFTSLMNDAGKKAIQQVDSNCLIGTLATFAFANVQNYSTQHLTLQQIYALTGPDGTWDSIIQSLKAGINVGNSTSNAKYKVGFPVFQYHGAIDEILPMGAMDTLAKEYCSAGIPTKFNGTYPGDHALTLFEASPDVQNFLADRFAGKPFTSTGCPS